MARIHSCLGAQICCCWCGRHDGSDIGHGRPLALTSRVTAANTAQRTHDVRADEDDLEQRNMEQMDRWITTQRFSLSTRVSAKQKSSSCQNPGGIFSNSEAARSYPQTNSSLPDRLSSPPVLTSHKTNTRPHTRPPSLVPPSPHTYQAPSRRQ